MSEGKTVTPSAPLESRKDFENNPRGQYRYWHTELTAAEKTLRAFQKQGNDIVKRYVAESSIGLGRSFTAGYGAGTVGFKLNLFYANVTTLLSALYGNVPKIDVSRRYADADDDIGRVASEIIQRLLTNDIMDNTQEIDGVLRETLKDRLTVGLGVARVRYKADFAKMKTVDGDAEIEMLIKEACYCEYVHWRDVRWGWARKFDDVKWIGFRAYMTKDEVEERFSKKISEKLQYQAQQALDEESVGTNDENSDAWMKAEVWEIWDKVKRQVVWVSIGYDKVLDTKDDPLRLNNFYPCPPFFAANTTSTLYIPTADYHLSQDLYNEVDKLQSRIAIITEAVKVVGVYDSTNGEIARMLKEGTDNDLIPVQNWALFGEKGGLQGQIDWFPIQDVVAALVQLIQMRDQTIGLLQQVTGMNDLMRGQLQNQYEGVGQSQMKAQMGSVRIQALQDQFSDFSSDLMRLKAEVIGRHYDMETIVKGSNAERLNENDRALVAPAVQLIKNPDVAKLHIAIRPESLAMVDYAALKAERAEYITALATFMQSAAPLVEMDASLSPFLLQLLQWGLSGFKGSSEIEGVIDGAIAQAKKKMEEAAQQPPETPPEVQMEQMRQQFQMQLEQFKSQSEMQKIQAKAAADTQVRQSDMQADLQTASAEHMAEIERMQVEMITTLSEIKAKLQADLEKERSQAEMNIAQAQATAAAEVQKDVAEKELELAGDAAKTSMEIDKIQAASAAKIDEASKTAKMKGESDASKPKRPKGEDS